MAMASIHRAIASVSSVRKEYGVEEGQVWGSGRTCSVRGSRNGYRVGSVAACSADAVRSAPW